MSDALSPDDVPEMDTVVRLNDKQVECLLGWFEMMGKEGRYIPIDTYVRHKRGADKRPLNLG